MKFINRLLSDGINPIKLSIAIFIIVFIIEILLDLFVGVRLGRFYLGDSNLGEKLTFSQIPGRLPQYFVYSILVGLFVFVVVNESQKSKKKNKYNR